MSEDRKAYIEYQYQLTYMEYIRGMNEYMRIEQGGGAITTAARQKLLVRWSTALTNMYMRLCFLAMVLQ